MKTAKREFQRTLTVTKDHRVSLRVPFAAGRKVKVVVIPKDNFESDLLSASASSTQFWDNPIDDAEWNIVLNTQKRTAPDDCSL